MSHLDEFQTEMTDQEALIKALCRMGFTRDQIEVHERAQTIIGYHGTEDRKVGHIIIRQAYSRIPSDIGWEKKNGNFVGHVDAFDYRGPGWRDRCKGGINNVIYDKTWNVQLLNNYNFEKSKMALEARGIKCTECKDSRGRLQLRAIMKINKLKTKVL
jgi:hypothetical protein